MGDEIEEAQDGQAAATEAGGNADQSIGDHRGQQLQADGVVAVAEELADVEMLLDPAEQQFDLPAAFVERCDFDRRAFEVIGQEIDRATALMAQQADAAQAHRQLGIALAGEADLSVFENGEAVALGNLDGALFNQFEAILTLGLVTKTDFAAWMAHHQP